MRPAGDNSVTVALTDVATLLGLFVVSTMVLVTFGPGALNVTKIAWCTLRTLPHAAGAETSAATGHNVANGWSETATAPPPTFVRLVFPARHESLLLNKSLHAFREQVNALHQYEFARRLAYQSFRLVAAERNSWERTWFRLGRPNPDVTVVQTTLLRLERAYSTANQRLLTLQAQERQSGSVSFFTPPLF
jgi:hypothetical protein